MNRTNIYYIVDTNMRFRTYITRKKEEKIKKKILPYIARAPSVYQVYHVLELRPADNPTINVYGIVVVKSSILLTSIKSS
jgi:hypothetical protein